MKALSVKNLLLLIMLSSLSACSWFGDLFESAPPPPAQPTRDFSKFPYELMAPEAPPPLKPEFKSARPDPADEFVWRQGHWSYSDVSGFTWQSGYWIRRPSFTAVWKPDFWIQRAYGWTLVPGHWQ